MFSLSSAKSVTFNRVTKTNDTIDIGFYLNSFLKTIRAAKETIFFDWFEISEEELEKNNQIIIQCWGTYIF